MGFYTFVAWIGRPGRIGDSWDGCRRWDGIGWFEDEELGGMGWCSDEEMGQDEMGWDGVGLGMGL